MERSFEIFPPLGPLIIFGALLVLIITLIGMISGDKEEKKDRKRQGAVRNFSQDDETKFIKLFGVSPHAAEEIVRYPLRQKFLGKKHELASFMVRKVRLKSKSGELSDQDKEEIERLEKEERRIIKELSEWVDFAARLRPHVVEDLKAELDLNYIFEDQNGQMQEQTVG